MTDSPTDELTEAARKRLADPNWTAYPSGTRFEPADSPLPSPSLAFERAVQELRTVSELRRPRRRWL